MGWKYFDYICECGNTFESMEKNSTDEVRCTAVTTEALQGIPEVLCGLVAKYTPSANLGWTNDVGIQREMLKKRSAEHTKREQKNGNMKSVRDL
ncbi:MAG: hypothetical protein L3J47_00295 [Sulfurovum sp.]|nr:hypothetical protein [Sulfurovum sp.]